jgi:hypothetical protein
MMTESINFEPIPRNALYQGTTLVVPLNDEGFSPCGAIFLLGSPSASVRQFNPPPGHTLRSIH